MIRFICMVLVGFIFATIAEYVGGRILLPAIGLIAPEFWTWFWFDVVIIIIYAAATLIISALDND